ncbi:ribonuclease G [bacterium]|nr:ribonuclease G [bacterium]
MAPANAAAEKTLPAEYQKFNWGAFLLTWIWGLGNNVYIALLVFLFFVLGFIPIVNLFSGLASLAFCIWLGIKGNELAWKNKSWNSLEHFNEVQRKWAMWGAIITCILIAIIVVGVVLIIVLAAAAASTASY